VKEHGKSIRRQALLSHFTVGCDTHDVSKIRSDQTLRVSEGRDGGTARYGGL